MEQDANTIDVKSEKCWQVKRRHWSHYIGLISLLQKPLIIPSEHQTIQPGDAFEDNALTHGLEWSHPIVVSALHFFMII
jgi:hypothetical protein